MQPLESLIRTAEEEVSRVMQICNACRYCETYCAVFPAMTRRLSFDASDAHYLAKQKPNDLAADVALLEGKSFRVLLARPLN